jgi:hypothetical protein
MERAKSTVAAMRGGEDEDASRQVVSARSRIERARHLFQVPEARISMAAQSSTMEESARPSWLCSDNPRITQRDAESNARMQSTNANPDVMVRTEGAQTSRTELGRRSGWDDNAPPRSLSSTVHSATKMQANRLLFAAQSLTSDRGRFKTSAVQSVDSESEAD